MDTMSGPKFEGHCMLFSYFRLLVLMVEGLVQEMGIGVIMILHGCMVLRRRFLQV
jgi:hypothetical protein